MAWPNRRPGVTSTEQPGSRSKVTSAFPHASGRPHVVVIGAGFAGLNAVHELRGAPVDITIIDRNNFHTFQPLLYQVATSYLPPEQVGSTIRTIFRRQKNVKVRVGEVSGVEWDTQTVELTDGTTVPYDYLVLAAGATTNFFGIPGMDEHAYPLYTMSDAVRLRLHLLEEIEQAARDRSSDRSHETVVVVGGGPTGVETAGSLAEMSCHHIGGEVDLRVVLVEMMPRLLNTFSEQSGEQTLKDLRKRGVEILLNTSVKSADEKGVELSDGQRIETRTVVWGAGVQASPLGRKLGLELGRGGSIVVEPDLRVPGRDNVFAIGDIASPKRPEGARPFPLVAPNAIQQGKHTGKQIAKLVAGQQPAPFEYFDKGILAVIAKGDAVAELPLPGSSGKRIKAKGFPAWALWAGVHIVYLVGFRNRLKTLTDWVYNFGLGSGGGGILVRASRGGKVDSP
nr:NAD(P)/FAD-dependent oxidoreductase [Motilibacter aurantiacus]